MVTNGYNESEKCNFFKSFVSRANSEQLQQVIKYQSYFIYILSWLPKEGKEREEFVKKWLTNADTKYLQKLVDDRSSFFVQMFNNIPTDDLTTQFVDKLFNGISPQQLQKLITNSENLEATLSFLSEKNIQIFLRTWVKGNSSKHLQQCIKNQDIFLQLLNSIDEDQNARREFISTWIHGASPDYLRNIIQDHNKLNSIIDVLPEEKKVFWI